VKLSIIGMIGALAVLLARPAVAQLQPPAGVGGRALAEARASAVITTSIETEAAGDHQHALGLADAAIQADPDDPWGYYVRGNALLSLARVDDAVTAYRDAEQRSTASDPWGMSVAIWGQANAYYQLARCHDATPIYERYAAFVERIDPAAAALAREFAKKQCAPPVPGPFAELDPAWEHTHHGDALVASRRFDEAVAAYREAEQRLPATDTWARSIAIWGQANALKEAGRCTEAAPIYERYARFVEQRDPQAAAMARQYAKKTCLPLRTGG
jgi:tetratricopeptide (TPR) repeat protein